MSMIEKTETERPTVQPEPDGHWEWGLAREDLDAEGIVREADVLFEAVCLHLGPAADPGLLIDGLDRCLMTSGPHATLALAGFRDRPRRELAGRAEAIGRQLVVWARAANRAQTALGRYGAERLLRLEFESLCAGHNWVPDVVMLLFGPAGGRLVVQLYNEWLHQLVLLRDMLLPFEDWRSRVFATSRLQDGRGLRAFNEARLAFASEIGSQLPMAHSLARLASSVAQLPSTETATERPLSAFLAGGQPRLLDIDLLRVFQTVVRAGGFTAAAQILNRTQAGVSMQVKRLEELVQAQLLGRSGRTLQLTAEGQTLLGFADRMLQLNEEALARLSGGHVGGPVRLMTNGLVAQWLLPALAAEFQKNHPEAWVDARIVPIMACAASGDGDGHADLVLDFTRAGSGGPSFRPAALHWHTSRRMSAHQRTPVPVALPPAENPLATWMVDALDKANVRWETVLVTDSQATIETMVRDGRAISAWPCLEGVPSHDMFRRLSEGDGLPALPDIKLSITTPGAFVSLGAQKLRDLALALLPAARSDQ